MCSFQASLNKSARGFDLALLYLSPLKPQIPVAVSVHWGGLMMLRPLPLTWLTLTPDIVVPEDLM